MNPEFTHIEPMFSREGEINYHPCAIGLHIYYIPKNPDGKGTQPFTALNLPARSDDEARAMWAAAKAEASLHTREGEDFLCDLNLIDGTVDDFSTNLQLLPRLVAAALAEQARAG